MMNHTVGIYRQILCSMNIHKPIPRNGLIEILNTVITHSFDFSFLCVCDVTLLWLTYLSRSHEGQIDNKHTNLFRTADCPLHCPDLHLDVHRRPAVDIHTDAGVRDIVGIAGVG